MANKFKVITIDGPAGTGKSTIAKRLADMIEFAYLDTGAVYRAITWKIIKEKISLDETKKLSTLLETFNFVIKQNSYFVDNEDVTELIRTKEVTAFVSEVSALKLVRQALIPIQTQLAKSNNLVVEGRDLGTVVFPNADIKFFLTASPEIRAQRRHKELKKNFRIKLFHTKPY